MDQIYYRPVPGRAGPRLAGGWLRFEAVEALSRSAPPRMMPVADLPAEVLDRLTRPRAPLAGLAMDRPQIMGIVNVTPDSFSDGGAWFDTGRAVDHGRALAQGGAAILDIGGESTRPGAAELPVAEEVALGARLSGAEDPEAEGRQLLERLRLGHVAEANPFTLSGGEKRRLSVGTALAARPRILVLDEPTFGQDAITWARLVRLLRELMRAGTAVVSVTHDLEFADALGGRRLILPGKGARG